MTSRRSSGVSFVVPVHNGASFICDTLEAIYAQDVDVECPIEVIAVDDCSDDDSSRLLRQFADTKPLRIIHGTGRGAAAAINTGIRAARFPLICQVDQDVIVSPNWTRLLVAHFDDPSIAAAQGYYTTPQSAALPSRLMGLDLEMRYAAITGDHLEHVCTGNSVYRASALHQVGLFDETLGYGYDNDMSYRLQKAGYRLAFCRQARSVHHWREEIVGYVNQQYGFGYGRLDVIAKHPRRVSGDAVSPIAMIMHAGVMALTVAGIAVAAVMAVTAGPWRVAMFASLVLLAGLTVERMIAGLRAARCFGDSTALLFAPFHLVRDIAWVAAMVVWSARRLSRRQAHPGHSMRPRGRSNSSKHDDPLTGNRKLSRPGRVLGLIPAHNEAANLTAVIDEIEETAILAAELRETRAARVTDDDKGGDDPR